MSFRVYVLFILLPYMFRSERLASRCRSNAVEPYPKLSVAKVMSLFDQKKCISEIRNKSCSFYFRIVYQV